MTRRILIDGRRAQGSRAGVGHYTKAIASLWPDPDDTVVLLADHLPTETFGPLTTRTLGGGPVWNLRAARLARRENAHFFSPESYLVPLLLGKRALITVHDLTSLDLAHLQTRLRAVVTRVLLRSTVRRAGAIIVPTEAVRADLLRHFPGVDGKTTVVHEGIREFSDVPSPEAEAAVAELEPYMLYVGTVEPRKNVLPLIDAFLDAAPADWNLVIVGQIGWLSEPDLARFAELALDPRVHHLGYVADEWLGPIFRAASVFAYVSESEGFGLPVAEAMAAGLPVIHTDDPALLEVGDGAGIVVRRAHLASDLRSAITTATALDAPERARLVAESLRAGARFDWARAARATRDLVTSLR